MESTSKYSEILADMEEQVTMQEQEKEEQKKKREEQKKAKEEQEKNVKDRIPLFENRRAQKVKISAKKIKEVLEELRKSLFPAKNFKELGEALINERLKSLKDIYTSEEVQEIMNFFSEKRLKETGEYLISLSKMYKDDKVKAMKERQKLITKLLETGIFGYPYDREIKEIEIEGKKIIIQNYKFTNLQRYQATTFLSFLKDIAQAGELDSTYKNFLEYINSLKSKELKKREDDKEKKKDIFGPRGNEWKELPESKKEEFLKRRNIMRAYKNQRYAIKVNYATEYPELFKPVSLKKLDKYFVPGTIRPGYESTKGMFTGQPMKYKIEKPTGLKNIEREMEALRAQGFNKKETIENVPELTREQFESYKTTFAPPDGSVYERKRLKDIVKHIALYLNPKDYDRKILIKQFINEHPANGKEIVDEVLDELNLKLEDL